MNEALINRVLVATDFSACARRALEYGVYVARIWSAHMDLLHVVEMQPGLELDASVPDPLVELRRGGRVAEHAYPADGSLGDERHEGGDQRRA